MKVVDNEQLVDGHAYDLYPVCYHGVCFEGVACRSRTKCFAADKVLQLQKSSMVKRHTSVLGLTRAGVCGGAGQESGVVWLLLLHALQVGGSSWLCLCSWQAFIHIPPT